MSVFIPATLPGSASPSAALPPDVAAIGTPSEIFDLAASKHSGNTYLTIAICLIFTVICFVTAVPMIVCGIQPFVRTPPPPVVCFGIGGFCLALGVGFAYGAYYFAFQSRARREAYYVFPYALVVANENGLRPIAWHQIGPVKPASTIDLEHVFPVEGEEDIRFDHASALHEALEMAITHRSTKARWKRQLSSEVRAAFSRTHSPPAFLAHDPSDGGLFRVSHLGDHLLFARLGDGAATGTRGFAPTSAPADAPADAPPVKGGLASGLAAWTQSEKLAELQAVLDRFDGIDECRLFDLAAVLPGSRLLHPDDISSAEIAPPTTWEKMSTRAHVTAVLKFAHREWGDKKMYLESPAEVARATEVLAEVLRAPASGDAPREELETSR